MLQYTNVGGLASIVRMLSLRHIRLSLWNRSYSLRAIFRNVMIESGFSVIFQSALSATIDSVNNFKTDELSPKALLYI